LARTPYSFDRVAGGSAEHITAERELLGAARSLPMHYRAAAGSARNAEDFFVIVRDADRHCVGGFLVGVRRIRFAPALYLWRLDRFGETVPAGALGQALGFLLHLAQTTWVIRLNVSTFSIDRTVRVAVGAVLEEQGFARAEPNTYTRTIAVDLRPEDLIASFRKTIRKRLREFERSLIPIAVQHITDVRLAPRLDVLMRETMARTGGRNVPIDWTKQIEFSKREPHLSRIVGVFRQDVDGPEALVAFVRACHHGNHAQYSEGASTRLVQRSVPLMHAPLIELMLWARTHGAQWFDMGGVTLGHQSDADDLLGGISDFKRAFSEHVVDVADEWVFEPTTTVATLVRGANRVLHRMRLALTASYHHAPKRGIIQ
jgi:hypothetical protein